MERISVSELPVGTTAKIKKRAKLLGFVKKNKEPHLASYIRHLIFTDIQK